MAILNQSNLYTSGESVTAANLNALIGQATFSTNNGEAVDGTTLQVHSTDGYLMVKDGGISATKLAPGAVDSAIGAGGITDTQLASDAVTTIKIADNAITSAKISDTDTQFLVDDTSAQKKVVINEAGADVDFRVEGDANANLINANAQNDIIGFGLVPDATDTFGSDKYTAQVKDGFRIFHDDGLAKLKLLTSKSGGGGASITLQSTTPVTADESFYSMFIGGALGKFNIINENTSKGILLDKLGAWYPTQDYSALSNPSQTLGLGSNRWSVIFSASGTINTSDRNSKEEIQDLSDAELRVAQACKGLVKRFKFKGGTRKHIGVIAQDVRDAFTAESLDAHEYGLFCSDTWTDENTGEEVTQLGIRYEELLAFIISAL
tara:strand:+ start:53 stop:1189 length:1137 start_codon:yes stop_codon:yes gene_type:complete